MHLFREAVVMRAIEPGQPGGIAVDGDTVYVDTFGFVIRPADGHDNVYFYDLNTG